MERHFSPEKTQAKLRKLSYLTLIDLTTKSIKIDVFIYNHHWNINLQIPSAERKYLIVWYNLLSVFPMLLHLLKQRRWNNIVLIEFRNERERESTISQIARKSLESKGHSEKTISADNIPNSSRVNKDFIRRLACFVNIPPHYKQINQVGLT